MPGLLLLRKRRLTVIHKPQETPNGNGHFESVSLPPELWACIAAFLDPLDLSRLYCLNRAFYNVFLSRKFQHVTLLLPNARSCNVRKELALLRGMRDPLIKEKIQHLYFDSEWEVNLISALDLDSWKSYFPRAWSRLVLSITGQMENAKRRAIQETVHGTLSNLSNVNRLCIHFGRVSNPLTVDTLWTGCSQTLVTLTLIFSRRLLDHTFGLGMVCPRLRSLHFTVFADSPPYFELLNEVRSLIPEDGGCLEELSIHLYGDQPPLIHCTSFGSLTKLSLHGHPTAIPSILPFITAYRDTLQDMTLGANLSMDMRNLILLNTSILTSLSVDAGALLEHHEEMFPFLSRCTCLRTLALTSRLLSKKPSLQRMALFTNLLHSLPSSLTHVTIPGLIVDFQLFSSIYQCLPNISSLTLAACYPANQKITALLLPRQRENHPQTFGTPWTLQFEDLFHARLQASTREALCGSQRSPEAISKLFLECLADSCPRRFLPRPI